MTNLLKQYIAIVLMILFVGCQEDDGEFGAVLAPTNLEVQVTVATDQSGNVTLTPTAENAINFLVYFTEDAEPVIASSSGQAVSYRYTQSGMYSQVINVVANGTGGVSSSLAVTVDLDVRLVIDQQLLSQIAGDGEKRWVWDASNAGHFGVGDPVESFPNFFSATPNSLNGCLYDDVLIFSHDGNDNYAFELLTAGATFINWAEVKRFFPDATPQEFEDECRDVSNQLDLVTDFVIIEDNDTGKNILTVTNSTLSYWSGAMSYEIVELTAGKLVVRGLQDPFDPTGNQLAWYHTFVPEGGAPACSAGSTGNSGTGNNDVLVWADEFDETGAPCSNNWSYDIGTGDNGWGNGESQYYTDRSENVRVEDGVLKITAKAESLNGSNYTSARLNTKSKFAFQYGKVEVRAKLPTGVGTWPAIWSLGADIDTNPWPGAGEMDIVEHLGRDQNRIFSTMHFPGNSGGNSIGDSVIVSGVSDVFHIYTMEWDANEVVFAVDGTVHFTFPNSSSVPFNKDFFLLVNVAMGGNFGGSIDPAFQESTMELDYIRVYQ
ncbi:MAG: beta-glucanase (GH16 family) [Flavobacteriales bacterium]|jgi:beta-glucanase (GH16 family)